MTEITAQQAQELLEKATPGPWRIGRRDLDNEDQIPQNLPTRNIPLLLAAPDLAETVITLTERLARAREAWRQAGNYSDEAYQTYVLGGDAE